MSVRQLEDDEPIRREAGPPRETPPPAGGGIRLEDVLRLLLASAVVLGGGLALGAFNIEELHGRGSAYFVIAACLAVILTALAYYRFEFCLVAYVAVAWITFGRTPSLANGVSSGTGKAVFPVELATLFLLFIWFLRDVSQREYRFARTPLDRFLIFYLLFCVWSAINGFLFWDSSVARYYQDMGMPNGGRTSPFVTLIEMLLRVLSVGAFWLMASNLTERKWLRRASLLLLLPGVISCLAHLHVLPMPSNPYSSLLEFVTGCTVFAWLLEGRAPAQDPRGLSRYRWLRALGWLLLGLLILQLFLVNIKWISGWLGLFVGLYFVAFVKSKKLFVGLVCLGLVLTLAFMPFLHKNVVHKVQTSGDTDRLDMARGAVLYALHFPLGVGVGNYRAYNLYYGGARQWGTKAYTSAHNFYGQALAETGFVGLLLTLLWVVGGLVMLLRFYHRLPPGFSRTVVLGVAGMWAGLAVTSYVGDYLIPVYHNNGVLTMAATVYAWIALGIATAHARLHGALGTAKEPLPRPAPSAPPRISAAEYYPRRMSR